MTATPSSFAFGNISTTKTRHTTIAITNTGKGYLSGIEASMLTGTACDVSSVSSTTAPATIDVACTPTVAGAFSDTLNVRCDQFATALGVAVSGTGISGQIITVSNTSVTGDLNNIYDTFTKGQSFKSPLNGHLIAFRFKTGASLGTAPVAAIRCGTSVDLTAATEYTVSIAAANTVYGVTLTTPIAVTSGQTVYCGIRNTKTTYTDRMSIQYANPGTYADGAEYQASSWSLTGISAYDLYFAGDFQ